MEAAPDRSPAAASTAGKGTRETRRIYETAHNGVVQRISRPDEPQAQRRVNWLCARRATESRPRHNVPSSILHVRFRQ